MQLFQTGLCRPEDYHLWYSAAKEGFLAVAAVMTFLSMGIAYLAFCNPTMAVLLKARNLRKKEKDGVCDYCGMLQPEISVVIDPGDPCYADFEKSGTKIMLEEKELCRQ